VRDPSAGVGGEHHERCVRGEWCASPVLVHGIHLEAGCGELLSKGVSVAESEARRLGHAFTSSQELVVEHGRYDAIVGLGHVCPLDERPMWGVAARAFLRPPGFPGTGYGVPAVEGEHST
jgi:hypothetical protein